MEGHRKTSILQPFTLSFFLPVIDIFHNPAITSGPETDELMDKSLALNTPVSLPVSFTHFHSGTQLPGQSDSSFCLFLQEHWILPVLSSVFISVREWVCGQQTHAVSVHSVDFSLYVWVPVFHQENFFFNFVCFGRETEVKQTRQKHRIRQRRKWKCPKKINNKKKINPFRCIFTVYSLYRIHYIFTSEVFNLCSSAHLNDSVLLPWSAIVQLNDGTVYFVFVNVSLVVICFHVHSNTTTTAVCEEYFLNK